ncbi:16S rRNA (guanine966-N2)-methyltransferase [Dysgonomonas sp. PH5-45]|uniref:16S rRNA (guanine(966)-N(2))-methyltransferase RsmD n=1 Tax=unclassified Dysgonomonas TaxID=2630389 RepID=UPI00247334B5|nr:MULTISPECIES: 16S rRNA (guanine(966)-N(2))-methyltransferase RsmD [unclassified Dysgonomonas]MDH6355895.1 16S rRNA (guanine966-N2)-methyltransferase [Dysgonomonas sp. PH5-45]MDH6388797.1 16S rRNA (guanine966-N2)-methyltransferase [Dysgonomonas sp. PH5-37]
MRIISGRYKGKRLSLPKNFKARPTTDFAKENLFNALGNYVEWESVESALDLFGGTGSISLELVSRGCRKVFCVEKDFQNYNFIEKNKQELEAKELTVFKMDVFRFLLFCKDKFDFIFADPPYDLKFLADVPKQVIEKKLLADGGVFVMEHSKDYDFSNLSLFKEKRVYGSVNFSIFVK